MRKILSLKKKKLDILAFNGGYRNISELEIEDSYDHQMTVYEDCNMFYGRTTYS